MKKSKLTVTVGIPAFNEEANIGFLIIELLSQQKTKFRLENIIVSSDGSRDRTVEIVKKIKNPKVLVINNKQRKGQANRQNQIIKKTDSDILVLVNADTSIKDKRFIERIIQPIISDEADLTSARVEELFPENFIETVLDMSMKIKKYIFEHYENGNNLYTCHGRARAFSKRFYKKIKFINSIGEDAYSYLFCKQNGFKYKFVKNTEIFYKLPGNFSDHQKQSTRFIQTQEKLAKEFGREFVLENYRLPKTLLMISLIEFSSRKPLLVLAYLLFFGYMKIVALFKSVQNIWEISNSSKSLR